jgi:urease accessory protein UreF
MSSALLSLLQLSDPALPIGGYAHSAGLETYVQQGAVHNLATAKSFITEMLSRNIFTRMLLLYRWLLMPCQKMTRQKYWHWMKNVLQ